MNEVSKRKFFIMSLFFFSLNAFSMTNEDYRYFIGYQSFLEKNYLGCATQMESLKNSMDSFSPQSQSQILLYRSFCNAKLGYKSYAALLIEEINPSLLSDEEKQLLNSLKSSIEVEINERDKVSTWVTAYGGSINYSPKPSKSSASLYGVSVSALTAREKLNFGIGAEKMELKLVNNLPSYTQTQAHFLLGKKFGDIFTLQAFLTNITTSNSKTAGGSEGNVYGLVSSFVISSTSQVNLEYDYSVYPSLHLGKTTIQQFVLSLDQTLFTGDSYTIASKILSQTEIPDSTLATDPTTGFTLKSYYERFALDLNLYLPQFQLGVSGWAGSEVLGTRGQGNLVFNAVEKHRYGYGANSQFQITPNLAVNMAYSKENFMITGPDITATTLIAGLTINF